LKSYNLQSAISNVFQYLSGDQQKDDKVDELRWKKVGGGAL
jgi:hypothetical protein